MATFKVGQRVRILAGPRATFLAGREATVLGALNPWARAESGGTFSGYPVDIDGYGRLNLHDEQIYVRPEQLSPLTDPGADAFLAKLKKLGDMPEQVRFVTTENGVFERKGDKLVKVSK